jgi:HlyD family secretion protein
MLRTKRFWIIFIVLALAVGGFLYYTSSTAAATPPDEPALQTAKVRTGDIAITASGAGNLVPAAELDLSFRTGGALVELRVNVGDHVEAGDVLARLDDASAKLQLAQAELNLHSAQAKLDDLETGASTGIDPDRVTSAYINLRQATDALADAQANYDAVFDPARDWELSDPTRADRLLAEREAAARALDKAKDALSIAQAQYNLTVSGLEQDLTSGQSAIAQQRTAVEQAQLSVESARLALSNTVLTAPVAGIVTAIKADVGEAVGTTPILTLADLEPPLVRFYVEENDLSKIAAGYPVSVLFDAAPDVLFGGTIIRVDPVLATVDGSPAGQAWAEIDAGDGAAALIAGMTAEVEIVAGEAKNALLVPVQALRELAPGSYAVFVVQPDGQLKLTPVTVGLKDFANAQILSGLKAGDVVSTGTVETK